MNSSKSITLEQQEALLKILKSRFGKYMNRHKEYALDRSPGENCRKS